MNGWFNSFWGGLVTAIVGIIVLVIAGGGTLLAGLAT